MIRMSLAGLALLALAAAAARADELAATACAAGLPPPARAIYDAAAPGFAASADPRDLVKSKTIALVEAGTVPAGEARPSAMAAGGCLMKLR